MLPGGVHCSFPLPDGVQMLGENAPSQLILYHYPDLKEEKGVVLMTAEMDPKFVVSPLPAVFTVWTRYMLIDGPYWCFCPYFPLYLQNVETSPSCEGCYSSMLMVLGQLV